MTDHHRLPEPFTSNRDSSAHPGRPPEHSGPARGRRGTTLLEVLIGAVLLALVAVPVFGLLWTSGQGIQRVDTNREARFLTDAILNAAENSDITEMWKNFGADFDGMNCPPGNSPITNGLGDKSRNPLVLEDQIFDRLKELGWSVTLRFRFLTKVEVGQVSTIKSNTGVNHLQAGIIWLQIKGRGVNENIKKTIFCPMILGRPGLDLKQCPAVNPELRDGLFAGYP